MKHHILLSLFRQYTRKRLYVIINILSLSIAITIALLVYSFVVKEIKTDSFHRYGDSIFRVLSKASATDRYRADHYGTLATMIHQQISGIDDFTRLWEIPSEIRTVADQPEGMREKCLYADSSFFKMFTFPLLWGSVDKNPPYQWAVISKKAARKYFGEGDPVGKYLYVSDKWWSSRHPQAYRIIAVMDNIPAWSTIQTDIVLDYRYMEQFTNWYSNCQTFTYVRLNPLNTVEATEENIRKAYRRIFPDYEGTFKLQPLADIYYNEARVYSSGDFLRGSLFFTRLLSGITLLILFLSSCSYMMIKIVQSQHNLKLFALQRCFGANSITIWKYFLTETAVYFFLSGILGILFTWILFPYFQEIVTPRFHYPFPVTTSSVIIFMSILCLFILFITTALSYYFLKRLNRGVKESIQASRQVFDLRKALACTSIAIFCMLLIDSTLVNRQMHYLKNKDLGYDPGQAITVLGCNEKLKTTLQDHPAVVSVTQGSSPLPFDGASFFKLRCEFEETGYMSFRSEIICGDENYLPTYGLELSEGENLTLSAQPVQNGYVDILVNQEFVRQAGIRHATGTLFKGYLLDDKDEKTTFRIIGVVKDFHYRPLYESISPLVICYSKGSASNGYLNNDLTTFSYLPGKRGELMKYLQEQQISIYSEYNYYQFYGKEEAFIRLINITACIALLIGGFGIFAFSVFYAASRKKEVALRKINGGTEGDIQKLLHSEFIRLTFYSCLIVIPIAYYLIYYWLQKFAYRITTEWYIFPGALVVCLCIVILIVNWQIRSVIKLNPVECLKEE